ncbi:signal peptide peptidase SppA [Bradyrhizobium sp. LM4.3]
MAEQLNDRESSGLADKLMQYLPARFRPGTAVVPVVRLFGVIGAVTPLRPGMTLATVARVLERAFSMRNAKAVALVINSPGGSPVQSRQIYLRIKQLAAEKKLPVLVFVEDVAASGGYMIACAGDEIICDPSSVLGSIGVVGGSFGFQEAIRRLGIERRLYTAGAHKAMLDPFLPENPDDVAKLKALQREIHRIFIALVKESRGARLKGDDDTLFTGEYWAGESSIALGLADSIGDLRSTLRARFGEKVLTPVIAQPSGLLSSLLGRKSPGAGQLSAMGISGWPAGRSDLGCRDTGDLGEIRVLDRGRPRHFARGVPIAARPGLRKNARGG